MHAAEGSDQPAQERPGHGADLLRRKEEAEYASLGVGVGVLSQNGIDRRIDAGKEQSDAKLRCCEQIQVARQRLDNAEDSGQGQGIGQRLMESLVLSEASPERRRYGAGKAAEREDEAGDEDDVVQIAGKFRNICRQDRLHDEDDHLHENAEKQHIADQRISPKAGTAGFRMPRCRLCSQTVRRFFDKEQKNQKIEEKSCRGQKE